MFLRTCFGTVFLFVVTIKAAPSPIPEDLQKASGVEEFLEKELQSMNKYRLMHAAAPLQLSLDLTNKAELWATQLANQDKEKIDVNSKYGQNIFSTKDEKDVATKSVQSWYNQIRFYDFHSAKESLKSSYFTQLVWVESQEVGIGKAKSSTGKTYIVALFNPPGNKGNFLHNVLPVTGSGVGKQGLSKCPNGYKLYNNICYKYFPGPVNWVQASEKCAADFATLASIGSQAEDIFVRTVLTSAGVSDAWIGVSDLTNDGVLSWLDGSPPHFMNWDFYQKNFPGKKCGVIFTNFNWKYKACDGSRGFVCKRPLRGITEYLVILRYQNKLWTDNLYVPGTPRYQALSRHIQEALLDVYGDFDWFEQVTVDHFSKGDEDKILAYFKLRFTPDDTSPADPIQFLRDSIQGNGASKRSVITGTLHGEKVQLVNATLIVVDQTPETCPSYCMSSQCMPAACSPWCCDSFGQQFFQSSYGAPQQPGYNMVGSPAGQIQGYPPPNPFSAPQQAQFQYRPQPQPAYPILPRQQPYQYPISPPQYPLPPQPQPYQYPVPPRPQQRQYQPQTPIRSPYPVPLRPQTYPFPIPVQPQQIRYQVPQRPATLPSPQFLILPRQPQPQHQAPQPYQAIPRPAYPQPWPVFPQPQQMIQQPPPQFLQMGQNTKEKQKPQAGQGKSPVQLQGVVTSYPFQQPYQPVPNPPMPFYQPTFQQYYQPTVAASKPRSQSKEKGKESEKESESGKEKSHEKPPPVTIPQPTYPYFGYPPQSSYPYYSTPMPSTQTPWKIRIYRPALTIPRSSPLPLINPGYPIPNMQQPAYQSYPVPPPQYRLPPAGLQPASPGLRPLEQRPFYPQVSPPQLGYPMQPPLPVSPYRPPFPYPNPYPGVQIPQTAPVRGRK